jgi:hypothetical protein
MKNLLYKTGHQISRKSRLTIMISIVNVLIISLILPLYLFSSPVMTKSYPIKSGSIKIDLVDRNKQRIGRLFYTDKFIENRQYNLKDGHNDKTELVNLWTNYPSLNKFSGFRFHSVKFSKYSDSYLDFTPKIMEELSTYLSNGAKTYIKVNITLTVSNPSLSPTLTHLD